jgi:hypothetical protein
MAFGGEGGEALVVGRLNGGGGGIAESFSSIPLYKLYSACLCNSYAVKLPPRTSPRRLLDLLGWDNPS